MSADPPADDSLRMPVHVHGPGRAACSIASLVGRAGGRVIGLSGGSESGAREAREALGAELSWSEDLPALPDDAWLLLGVPDDALSRVAWELSGRPLPASGLAIHLSGRSGRSVLAPLAARGLRTAALHPLRSFPSRRYEQSDLGGCLIAVDAGEETAPVLMALCRRLGGEPIPLAEEGRALYHLGASMFGNGVLGLAAFAVEALTAAGVPENLARHGLVNIGTSVLARAGRDGLAPSLTGPVVRGDIATLDAHLAAIEASLPAARGLYLGLVRAQLDLCRGRPDVQRSEPARKWLAEREREAVP